MTSQSRVLITHYKWAWPQRSTVLPTYRYESRHDSPNNGISHDLWEVHLLFCGFIPLHTHPSGHLCSPTFHKIVPHWRTPLLGSTGPPATAPGHPRSRPGQTPEWRSLSRLCEPPLLSVSLALGAPRGWVARRWVRARYSIPFRFYQSQSLHRLRRQWPQRPDCLPRSPGSQFLCLPRRRCLHRSRSRRSPCLFHRPKTPPEISAALWVSGLKRLYRSVHRPLCSNLQLELPFTTTALTYCTSTCRYVMSSRTRSGVLVHGSTCAVVMDVTFTSVLIVAVFQLEITCLRVNCSHVQMLKVAGC